MRKENKPLRAKFRVKERAAALFTQHQKNTDPKIQHWVNWEFGMKMLKDIHVKITPKLQALRAREEILEARWLS